MTEQLIPDPPLGDFPVLPDNMRWRIEPKKKPGPYTTTDYRRVHLEEKVTKSFMGFQKQEWVSVEMSVWESRTGLGDFRKANTVDWHLTTGLAGTMGYILDQVQKKSVSHNDYEDVHGVSKQ